MAANSRVFIYKKKRPQCATHTVDEIHAWHEQDFYYDIPDGPYYYDYQVGDYSIIQVEIE